MAGIYDMKLTAADGKLTKGESAIGHMRLSSALMCLLMKFSFIFDGTTQEEIFSPLAWHRRSNKSGRTGMALHDTVRASGSAGHLIIEAITEYRSAVIFYLTIEFPTNRDIMLIIHCRFCSRHEAHLVGRSIEAGRSFHATASDRK